MLAFSRTIKQTAVFIGLIAKAMPDPIKLKK
jgi:hypothetical protein